MNEITCLLPLKNMTEARTRTSLSNFSNNLIIFISASFHLPQFSASVKNGTISVKIFVFFSTHLGSKPD